MVLARSACTIAVALTVGCFTADFDPAKTGVFACVEPDGSDCPDGRVCINARCETDGPSLEIRNPEDEQTFDVSDAPPDEPRLVPVTIAGTLELVEPSDEHVHGEGHVAVFMDGVEITTVTSGAFSSGITVMLEVVNRPGPHRVAIVARRSDGVAYDNPEARFTRLFWIDDGTPQVALKSPWPNARFGLDSQIMEFEVTSLRVTLVPPVAEAPIDPARGHLHIYYDEMFPGCLMDPGCDANYIAIGEQPDVALMATIPDSAEGSARLTGVLRNIDHSLYLFDPDGAGPLTERPIIDSIEIVRTD